MESRRLPVLIEATARRIDPLPERTLYVARAGLGALPSGSFAVLLIMAPQFFSLGFLFWAIWWPYPDSTWGFDRALICTGVVSASILVVGWLLARWHRGFLLGVIRAPFIRITFTDRRLIWTLPWMAAPLLEIARPRMVRGILGVVDRRGRGNAAIELLPGDPVADIDGCIHFDRLPAVRQFMSALAAG